MERRAPATTRGTTVDARGHSRLVARRDLTRHLVSLVAFLTLGLAPLAVALDPRSSRAWATYSALSGMAVLTFFAATVVLSAQEERIITGAPVGLLQRISIVAGFAWLSAFFLRLWGSTVRK